MESNFNSTSRKIGKEQEQLAAFAKELSGGIGHITSNAFQNLFNTEKIIAPKSEADNLWGDTTKPTQGPEPFKLPNEIKPTQGPEPFKLPNELFPETEPTNETKHHIMRNTGILTGQIADISKEPVTAPLAGVNDTANKTVNDTTNTAKTDTAAANKAQEANNKTETKKKEDKKTDNTKQKKVSKEKTTTKGDTTTTVKTYKDGTKEKVIQTGDKTTTITYDKNGKRTNKSITEGTGDNIKETTVKYKNGVANKKTVVNGDKTSVTKYNEDGKRINKTVTQGEGENKVVATAKYDPETGNVTARTKEGLVDGNNVAVAKEYDPKTGKLSSKVTTTTLPSGVESKESTAYEYDADGNLTKRALTDNYGHITTTAFSDYQKQEDGTTTRNITTTITTATGNQIGEPVYKEQTISAAGKVVQSNWFYDAEHKEKRKEVSYDYDENNVKTGAHVMNFDKEGAKTRETTQSNFKTTLLGTTYDAEVRTYEPAADGTVKETVTKQNKIKYFDGSTFLKSEFDKNEYAIGQRRTPVEEETGEAKEKEDTEDTGKID